MLRRRVEVGAQQLGVNAGMPQRSRPVAGRLQGLHVSQRDPGVVGILPGEAGPPLDRPQAVAALRLPLRQLLQRLAVPAAQA